uniref:GDSL esterase/lipase n=1 Tax=Oryza meridionalis TaxID=40149 RepID=A0A0E0DZE9_9ORYZ
MACKKQKSKLMAFSLAMVVVVVLLLGRCRGDVVQFIFGDSLSDVGNNDYLTKSLARAALPWYGIDFDTGMPNGRFCNGRTVADIVGDKMGLPRPPAFLDPSLDENVILKRGVNFASGGGGILNETSSLFEATVPGMFVLQSARRIKSPPADSDRDTVRPTK